MDKLQSDGYNLFFRTARSFGDESSAPISVDFSKMIGGYIMMFLYVSLLLGNLNLVEGRFYLAIVGILARYPVLYCFKHDSLIFIQIL